MERIEKKLRKLVIHYFFLILNHYRPSFPKSPIVLAPFFLDTINPFSTFLEFPLVEIPIITSPFETKLSHCLLKTMS